MGLRITTSILSLMAQRNLANTSRALSKTMQRLASGLRVNSAMDDPAGLAIASGLEAQRRGALQAVRNINDSRGFLNTADGALAEQTNLVQRMRELAVQASNGIISDDTREYLDQECQELLAEFTRLTNQTQFNGTNLLDGTFTTRSIQVGHQKGQTISFEIGNMQTANVFGSPQSVTSTVYVGTGTFQSASSISLAGISTAITSNDFNGDGFNDLILTDDSSTTLSLYLGNGNGTFASRTTLSAGSNPRRVISADLNGDGNVDVIVENNGANQIKVLLGNGNGTFQAGNILTASSSTLCTIATDINRDGHLDLVTTDSADGTISINIGNGNGTFAARITTTSSSTPDSLVVGDLNSDGNVDLVAGDQVNDLISISLGNGNGTFGPRITYSQQNPSRLLVEDFNEDGTLDLLVGSNGGDTQVRLGNGNGTFAAGTLLLAGGSVARGGATITDYNNDGHLDVVAADNNGSQISIYCGNGNGTFASAITISTISNPVALLASDLDGDGVVDLVATSDSASQMKVHVAVSTATSTTTTSILPVSLSTQTRAEDTLNVLDSALGYLNSTRADIGATLSRLAFAANNSQNAIESISAARSQIMDADIAETLAEFSKLQILQKVGIAVLGQANLNQQATLRLLQNI